MDRHPPWGSETRPADGNMDRRRRLRRLDDLLEALETLNLHEVGSVPGPVAERLKELGVSEPQEHSITTLIDKVLEGQEGLMLTPLPVPVDRRRSRRRPVRQTVLTWADLKI
ncbi:MAG: hypothetical protein E6I70_14390 [Chloroflexi bacterium]|nr:MAG: hypothetical protein E6I63_12075 [Chloroflexota bacterium]TME15052.1 MAG: hypothetical protein E6I70_14390 [Chloroflexota bacterium]